MGKTGMTHAQKELILIADKEELICDTVSRFLIKKGYDAATATDGHTALRICQENKPHLIIADLLLPGISGVAFIKKARTLDAAIPILVTTDSPEIASVIPAMDAGALDYLVKPFSLDILLHKVERAIRTIHLVRENTALSELVSLHEIANTLANTHDIDELLNVAFQFCTAVLKVECCFIHILDRETDSLNLVRSSAEAPWPGKTRLSDTQTWPFAKQVIARGKTLTVTNGISEPALPASLPEWIRHGCFITIPLKAGQNMIGVISLCRAKPFTNIEESITEVLASQAGTAINNAILYASLKQKISEMSLISKYSDNFVGLIDLPEIIKCLFETVKSYFTIDVIGFLDIKKRFHQFLYWTRGRLSDDLIKTIMTDTIAEYNKTAKTAITLKRVKPVLLSAPGADADIQNQPFTFVHIIPLVWGDLNFGALYFGAEKKPEQKAEKISLLNNLVSQTRIALTSAKLYNQVKENYLRTIKALAIAVDAKDPSTYGHSENVMQIAEAIAGEMNAGDKVINTVRDSGLLHDIGKIGIPGYILNKPGPLTSEEFNGIMKTHSTLGANIVREVPFLQELSSLILYHHEHPDGTGYPEGLHGKEIPLGARIIHVADAFEAMVANRPYRSSLGKKEAVQRLIEGKGRDFDPDVVEAFFQIAKKKGWLSEEDFPH